MKHPRKLNFEMKKFLSKNNLNPLDYFYLKNTSDSLSIIHKQTKEVKELKYDVC